MLLFVLPFIKKTLPMKMSQNRLLHEVILRQREKIRNKAQMKFLTHFWETTRAKSKTLLIDSKSSTSYEMLTWVLNVAAYWCSGEPIWSFEMCLSNSEYSLCCASWARKVLRHARRIVTLESREKVYLSCGKGSGTPSLLPRSKIKLCVWWIFRGRLNEKSVADCKLDPTTNDIELAIWKHLSEHVSPVSICHYNHWTFRHPCC